MACGCSSVVERDLAKVDAARSNRVTRFHIYTLNNLSIYQKATQNCLNGHEGNRTPDTVVRSHVL